MLQKTCAVMNTSIGKKAAMAVTGLMLSGFLIFHMLGNLLLYAGEAAFMEYANGMHKYPAVIIFGRAGLITVFLVHIFLAIKTTLENRRAKPQRYGVYTRAGGATLASRTMALTGATLLAYLILHISSFTLRVGALPEMNLYQVVVFRFMDPVYTSIYVVSMIVLGIHLAHGLSSSLQTLGLINNRNESWTRMASMGFAVTVATVFASIPLYLHLQQAGVFP